MSVERWNDIFSLLSMVVIADKRVYKEEVDAFVASVMDIKAAIDKAARDKAVSDDDTLITAGLAFEWFRGNRADILAQVSAPEYPMSALKKIFALDGFAQRKEILRAMLIISMADKDYHPSEENLVDIAAAHWGLDLNDIMPKK